MSSTCREFPKSVKDASEQMSEIIVQLRSFADHLKVIEEYKKGHLRDISHGDGAQESKRP